MPTPIQNQLYKYVVNGQVYYDAGAQVPPGATSVSSQEFLQGAQALVDKYKGYSDSNSVQNVSGWQKAIDQVKTGMTNSGYETLTPEEMQTYGFSSNFVKAGTLDYAKQQAADIASGALVQIGTAPGGQPLYAPKGSPATQPLQSAQTPPGAPVGSSAGSQQPSAIQPPTSPLQPGQQGDQVRQLQQYLVSQGLMTQADMDTGVGIYGAKTTAAVKALQAKLGVDNSSGVGFYGARTIQAAGAQASAPNAPTGQISTNTGGSAAASNAQAQLQTLLGSSGLTPDQKQIAQHAYDLISTNDAAQAARLMDGFKAASEYSNPYFKAQTALVTDALSRALGANEGDLAFHEKQLASTLNDLTANINASKDQLDFTHAQELKNLQTSYQTDLENTQQNLASVGKTSSSVRSKSEQLLKDQNEGLLQTSNRNFAFQTGNLDRQLISKQTDNAQQFAYLQDQNTQKRIDALRTTEGQVGSTELGNLGYTGLLGGVGGSIPRQQAVDAMSFANQFTGSNPSLTF